MRLDSSGRAGVPLVFRRKRRHKRQAVHANAARASGVPRRVGERPAAPIRKFRAVLPWRALPNREKQPGKHGGRPRPRSGRSSLSPAGIRAETPRHTGSENPATDAARLPGGGCRCDVPELGGRPGGDPHPEMGTASGRGIHPGADSRLGQGLPERPELPLGHPVGGRADRGYRGHALERPGPGLRNRLLPQPGVLEPRGHVGGADSRDALPV